MLVRRKHLRRAFPAAGGLGYRVDGSTILASEAEAPRILGLEALWSRSRFKQKSLSRLAPGQTRPALMTPGTGTGDAGECNFLLVAGFEGLDSGRDL